MKSRRRDAVLVIIALLVLVGVGAGVLLGLAPGEPPAGPAPIPWDRAVCSECGMHVGEPRFAAQLRDGHGDLHAFDDPGCLFTWRQHAGPVTAIYYHSGVGDAWLAESEVAFVEQQPTPMGYGLVAVPAGTPKSMSTAAAMELLIAQRRLGGGAGTPEPSTPGAPGHEGSRAVPPGDAGGAP